MGPEYPSRKPQVIYKPIQDPVWYHSCWVSSSGAVHVDKCTDILAATSAAGQEQAILGLKATLLSIYRANVVTWYQVWLLSEQLRVREKQMRASRCTCMCSQG